MHTDSAGCVFEALKINGPESTSYCIRITQNLISMPQLHFRIGGVHAVAYWIADIAAALK